MGKTTKKNTESFIERAKLVHGDTFDYSLVNYVNTSTKVKIICPIHGEFEQIPANHLRGAKCFKCKIDKLTSLNTLGVDEFIRKSKIKHKDKYDYSLVKYIKHDNKVKIICPIHGVFEQEPKVHYRGSGCFECGKKIGAEKLSKLKLMGLDVFVERSKLVHGEKYDYSLVEYISSEAKVNIICPIHGVFEQTPSIHLRGSGCNECGIEKTTNKVSYMYDKCVEVHGDKYQYDFTGYKNNTSKIGVYCEKHGWFKQRYNNHCDLKQGCPSCKAYRSKGEIEIYDFLVSLNVNVINNVKGVIDEEIDIYLPDLKIAIEYDGEYWHSTHNKDEKCEYDKMLKCNDKDIFLLIFRHKEWVEKGEIIKSMIKNKIGLIDNKIYGRKCVIKIVNKKDKSLFLKNNHIQGDSGSSIDIGLYYNDELVSLMSFSKFRKNMGLKNKDGHYELIRFCNKINFNVIGGFSKLLTYFVKEYKPIEVISYANRRWSQGNVYEKNNFEFIRNSPPTYKYLVNNKLIDRFNYRKDVLVSMGYDKNKTEKQIMDELGYPRLYDCGNKVYKLKK